MIAYYNENDKNTAAWLRQLIKQNLIMVGEVDERSIVDVCADDLRGYTRCHFFAGIGGWDYALRLAGWPDDRPVWTGSCPCQPFSAAGKRLGTADSRHLWPEFHRLITQCHPPIVFGEQVASKDGREWLAGVRTDLEALGYGVGAADLCAASAGAPHIRQRLYWLAQGVGDASPPRLQGQWYKHSQGSAGSGGQSRPTMQADWLGNTPSEQVGRAGQSWRDGVWLKCTDGKARRIEPGSFPLAHGVPARVGRLRGYGNAIVPQVAAQFIRAAVVTP